MTDTRLSVYNVLDYHKKKYLDYDELKIFCDDNGLEAVKKVKEGVFEYTSINELHELTKMKYDNTNNQIEGLIFRLKTNWWVGVSKSLKNNNENNDECNIEFGARFSFKIINNDYLINKHGEENLKMGLVRESETKR